MASRVLRRARVQSQVWDTEVPTASPHGCPHGTPRRSRMTTEEQPVKLTTCTPPPRILCAEPGTAVCAPFHDFSGDPRVARTRSPARPTVNQTCATAPFHATTRGPIPRPRWLHSSRLRALGRPLSSRIVQRDVRKRDAAPASTLEASTRTSSCPTTTSKTFPFACACSQHSRWAPRAVTTWWPPATGPREARPVTGRAPPRRR